MRKNPPFSANPSKMLKHIPAPLTPDAAAAPPAFAILACGETRTYGNVLMRNGVSREATA